MANLDRRMRSVVETFGAEAVVAWVRTNLTQSGYSSRRGAIGAAPAPTPNKVLFSSGSVLMDDGKKPAAAAAESDSDSSDNESETDRRLRNPASSPAPPKGRGLLAHLWA